MIRRLATNRLFARRPAVATPLMLAALALAMFGAWMHWAILDPRNIGWLLEGNDRGQNSLGLIAYLRMRPPWPSLHDPLLMAPDGLGVALTDSNPLLAILLRPFAGWLLPDGWQYAGLWVLLCVCLQVGFAWALVRPFAADRPAALVATALLAAVPVLFARYGHLNLCAQWLILWALWLFVGEERRRSALHWAAVIGVTGLIHPYLLVMVAAIWGSAQLRLLVTEPAARGATLAGAALGAGVLVGIPALLGFFAEPLASTGSYGIFGIAADALWNPGNQGYSALLPARAPNTAQGFEGSNYLGAGLIALTLAVGGVKLTGRYDALADDRPAPSLRGLLWLLPALLVLAVVASGTRLVWHGHIIASAPLPDSWIAALDPLRASGRMFWPAYYTIVFAVVASACRLREGRVLLLAAALLQLLDLAPAVAVMHGLTARADTRQVFVRTRDPRWQALVEGASSIEFHPGDAYRDLSLVEEIGWRAISACRPVPMRWFYASREPRSIRDRLARETRRFEAGRLDPGRLYILLKTAPPAAVAARARVLDGVTIVPPAIPLPPPAACISASSPRSAS